MNFVDRSTEIAHSFFLALNFAGTGALHVYELGDKDLTSVEEKEVRPASIKCCTLGASGLREPQVATGDFEGKLEVYDLDTMKPTYTVKGAHGAIINCIDGVGGSMRGKRRAGCEKRRVLASSVDLWPLIPALLLFSAPSNPPLVSFRFVSFQFRLRCS